MYVNGCECMCMPGFFLFVSVCMLCWWSLIFSCLELKKIINTQRGPLELQRAEIQETTTQKYNKKQTEGNKINMWSNKNSGWYLMQLIMHMALWFPLPISFHNSCIISSQFIDKKYWKKYDILFILMEWVMLTWPFHAISSTHFMKSND